MSDKPAFREQLRQWRQERAVRQADVDSFIGKAGYTAMLEADRLKPPPRDVCFKIAEALDLDGEEVWALSAPQRMAAYDENLLKWHHAEVERWSGPMSDEERRLAEVIRSNDDDVARMLEQVEELGVLSTTERELVVAVRRSDHPELAPRLRELVDDMLDKPPMGRRAGQPLGEARLGGQKDIGPPGAFLVHVITRLSLLSEVVRRQLWLLFNRQIQAASTILWRLEENPPEEVRIGPFRAVPTNPPNVVLGDHEHWEWAFLIYDQVLSVGACRPEDVHAVLASERAAFISRVEESASLQEIYDLERLRSDDAE